ncbi:MAG: hypothetical protein LQ349_005401 [Xanthoria aureola]|nr:MAG: hypothetical protein LQ349_005401 [Xanthoria aureola]
MLVYLAWFSSLTHLSTLTVLRQYFQDNSKARLWRAVLMLITVMMLGAALLPTGDNLWLNASEPLWRESDEDHVVPILAPALCYFRTLGSQSFEDWVKISSWTGASMIISLVVLISGYITRMLKLSDHASNTIRKYLREASSKAIRAIRGVILVRLNSPAPSFHKVHWVVAYTALETSYIWLKALFDIYESMTGDIIWLASALAFGTRNLFMARSDAGRSEENTWGFGQMFPVILLVLPILSALETYYEKDLSDDLPGEALESGLANNGISLPSNPRLPPLAFYIGHWQSKPQAAASSAVLDDGQTVRPAGTDLQLEAQTPGGHHTRTSLPSPQPGPTANNVNSESEFALAEPIGLATTLDYYQLHWFWIVVCIMLLQAMTLVAKVLATVRHPIEGWKLVYEPLTIYIGLYSVLTWGFLMLSRFHATLGQKVEKTLKISREKQERWLLVIAWSLVAVFLLLNLTLYIVQLWVFGLG